MLSLKSQQKNEDQGTCIFAAYHLPSIDTSSHPMASLKRNDVQLPMDDRNRIKRVVGQARQYLQSFQEFLVQVFVKDVKCFAY